LIEYLYHSHGSSALHHVHPGTIEQGQCQFAVDASLLPTSLSRARCYVLAGLAILTVLTIFFAVLGAHYVGKNHMPRIKMIAFMTIVVTSFYTVIAVVVAKRALQEALLFGITMLVVGSALLTQLDDFVRSF
jgi:magnesium-transporting ATPase (P-type)